MQANVTACKLKIFKRFEFQEASGSYKKLQEASGIFWNLQEPSGWFRNLQKPENFNLSTDGHTDISSSRAAPSQLKMS